MIGNRFLKELYEIKDEDTGLNILLETLKRKDQEFINSLNYPVDIGRCNEKEIRFLTIACSLIDYYLQEAGIDIPEWLRDSRLCFDKPYYWPSRLSDLEKLKLMISCPATFRARNVYFDLGGIHRI